MAPACTDADTDVLTTMHTDFLLSDDSYMALSPLTQRLCVVIRHSRGEGKWVTELGQEFITSETNLFP